MKFFGLSRVASRVFGVATLAVTLASALTACPGPPASCKLLIGTPTNPIGTIITSLNGFPVLVVGNLANSSANFSVSSTGCSFSGAVSLSVDNPASYPFTVSFNPQSGTSATSTGTVTIPTRILAGDFVVTVRASANGGAITTGLNVSVAGR